MIVAMDGPAGTGKSTIARMVAERNGFTYINSGNLYRAITYGAMRAGVALDDQAAVVSYAESAGLEYRGGALYLDGEPVESFLRSADVEAQVAQVSAIVPVLLLAFVISLPPLGTFRGQAGNEWVEPANACSTTPRPPCKVMWKWP